MSRLVRTVPLLLVAGLLACGDDDPTTARTPGTNGSATVTAATDGGRPTTTAEPAATGATSAVVTDPPPAGSTVSTPTAPTTSATAPVTTAPTATTAATTPSPTTVPAELTDTLVAIDGAGDAVAFPDGLQARPIVLFDGPDPDDPAPAEGPGPNVADGVAITPSGDTAYIGTCCEPIAGSILTAAPPAPATFGASPPLFGYGPAVSPGGRYLAAGQIALTVVSIRDLATDEVLDVPEFDAPGTYSPYDTMWLDDRRLASLGILGDPDASSWVMYPIEVTEDGVTVGAARDLSDRFGPTDDVLLRFAGRLADGRVAIHARGDASVEAVSFEPGPAVADQPVHEASGPALTIWLDPGQPPIVVTEERVLLVGDRQVPGEYLWART